MAHLAETTMIPPIPYVSEFNRDELKTVKLKHVSGLVTREKKVPVFSGKEGIEGLLFCEETTRNAFLYLGVTNGREMFNLYSETLSGGAVRKWNNVVGQITEAQRDVTRFDTAIREYYLHFVDEKARNTMYDYLTTKDCGKPFKASVFDHVDRMEELYRFSSKLPGTVPALNDSVADDRNRIKEKIYVTFPVRWQNTFDDSHDIETATQAEVNRFMNRQKARDAIQTKRKEVKSKKEKSKNNNDKKDTNSSKQEKGRKRNDNNKGSNKRRKQLDPDDTCPIHGGHKWISCFDNKSGPNYRPRGQGPGGRQDHKQDGRRESHYNNDSYYYKEDRGRSSHRNDSPARRAPSPLTLKSSGTGQ